MKLALVFPGAVILLLLCSLFYIASLQSQDFTISDFRAQYTGAILAQRKQYSGLYDLQTQYAVQKKLFPKLDYQQLLPFLSPPLVAFLISPLALLDFNQAYSIFGLGLVIMLFITSRLFFLSSKFPKRIGQIFNLQATDSLLWLYSFFPFWLNVLNTQFSLIWILAAFSSYLFLERKKYLLAGLTFSLLSLKIQLILVPLVFFVILRQWRVILGLGLGIFFLFFIQLAFFGFETVKEYYQLLLTLNFNLDSYGQNPSLQVSLKGALYWFLGDGVNANVIFSIWVTASILIVIAGIFVWLKKPPSNSQSLLKLQWSSMIVITLLTSPHTHYHDLSLLTIPIFLTLHYLVNDHLPKQKNLQKRSFYPWLKYGLILVLIILSATVSYFPPLVLLPYLCLFFFIVKLETLGASLTSV